MAKDASIQIGVRLERELLARVDAYAERVANELPGVKFGRSDAVRVLLTKALDLVEPKRARNRRG